MRIRKGKRLRFLIAEKERQQHFVYGYTVNCLPKWSQFAAWFDKRSMTWNVTELTTGRWIGIARSFAESVRKARDKLLVHGRTEFVARLNKYGKVKDLATYSKP